MTVAAPQGLAPFDGRDCGFHATTVLVLAQKNHDPSHHDVWANKEKEERKAHISIERRGNTVFYEKGSSISLTTMS